MAGRSHLTPEARGGGPEEPPGAGGQGRRLRPGAAAEGATRGVVAVLVQKGLEELSRVEGQERWR